jgi:DnaJ domain
MTAASDPYQTLGLAPGATSAEIKRAYRRLAKAYHPDSAGERALPRFLAIQAAYERLTSGQPGAKSTSGGTGGARRGPAPGPATPPPSRPWSADAERARATRDAFRKRSTRTGARSPAGATGAPPGPESSPGPGAGSAAGPSGPRASGARGPRRAKSKATIGSTSYDGTEGEPFEPGWSGAGWYGAASGTYWTINPKEYADPRKHGPEYLARARRGPKGAAGRADQPDSPEADGDPGSAAGPANPGRGESAPAAAEHEPAASGEPQDRPQGTTRRPPAAASLARAQPAETAGARAPGDRPPGPGGPPAVSPGTALPRAAPAARFNGLQPASVVASWRGRLLLAALAWFPIGLAVFGVHGQVSGCSQFLASCTDPVAWSVWIPQLVVVAVLLASPRLAWIAASGSIVLLCLTLPLAAILTAGSGGRPPSAATTELLYAAMAVGWLGGVGIALSGRIPLPPWRAARVR